MAKEQNKMKTLKQRMETELNTSLYLCHDFNEIEKEFLRLTKEWLTQKRQAHGNKCEGTEMLDELLEDLKQ
jgi:hypothetical protein